VVAPATLSQAVAQKLTGPYLTLSAAHAAGFRGWPLVVMTAIAGRESGWNNDAPHTDTNGIPSTGLWQINSSNTAGLTSPLQNAQAAFSLAGGNTLAGLRAWALTPPGGQSLTGITQPKPYPWGTVPPQSADDAGYTDPNTGKFVPFNYNLTASQVAQAVYAWTQAQLYGYATTAELNGSSGWGTTGGTMNASTVPSGLTSAEGASGLATGGGCSNKPPVISWDVKVTTISLSACNAKALKGGVLIALGGGVMLAGVAMIVISGLAGKGPLAPVVNVAEGYMRGASRLPVVGSAARQARTTKEIEGRQAAHATSVAHKRTTSPTERAQEEGRRQGREAGPFEGENPEPRKLEVVARRPAA
jgi:hypothetical protein